jgi:hypothetical protein
VHRAKDKQWLEEVIADHDTESAMDQDGDEVGPTEGSELAAVLATIAMLETRPASPFVSATLQASKERKAELEANQKKNKKEVDPATQRQRIHARILRVQSEAEAQYGKEHLKAKEECDLATEAVQKALDHQTEAEQKVKDIEQAHQELLQTIREGLQKFPSTHNGGATDKAPTTAPATQLVFTVDQVRTMMMEQQNLLVAQAQETHGTEAADLAREATGRLCANVLSTAAAMIPAGGTGEAAANVLTVAASQESDAAIAAKLNAEQM